MTSNDWKIGITKYEKGREAFNAALFSISNGYAGIRGTDEETYAGAPRTFVAGLFNPDPLGMETMASVQNWPATRLFIDGVQFFHDVGDLTEYRKTLDMRQGTLSRSLITRNRDGKTTRIDSERFASMSNPHLLALRYSVTPLDYSGEIKILTGIDGRIASSGFDHFDEIEKGSEHDAIFNVVKANRSDTVVAMAVSFDAPFEYTARVIETLKQTWLELTFNVRKGETYTLDKLTALFTSKDSANPKDDAVSSASAFCEKGYDELLLQHRKKWSELWQIHDVVIEGDPEAQKALRFCIYQLISYGPNYTSDTNIGAKALTGDRYRGHIFWDTEIYLQPFYNLASPELGRRLLMYRYNRLAPAKEKAKKLGARGACYVWESADSGKESVPVQWIFPHTGEIEILAFADEEIHTSLDVAYAIRHYHLSTGDGKFMSDYGLEVLLESALFYATKSGLNPETGQYEIRNITGPDEHHYGANNSVYMNYMARWNIRFALQMLEKLKSVEPESAEKILVSTGIRKDDLRLMKDVAERIKINYDPEIKLIEQFDGFFKLRDFPVRPKDLVPGEKLVSQIIKQADIVLLLVLRGEDFDIETKRKNYVYYEPRCEHESSLSASTHAILACELGRLDEAYKFFMNAATIDLKSEKWDCIEGIHIGSCGGAWQAVVFGFGGLHIGDNGLSINPRLPKNWKSLQFTIMYRGIRLAFRLKHDEINVHAENVCEIHVSDEPQTLVKGENSFTVKQNNRDN